MSKKPLKIAVVLVDRANYGRLKPVLMEIKKEPSIDMHIVCSGSMILERFGSPVKVLEKDGFTVSSQVHVELEGSNPTTMAKSVGFAVIEYTSELQRIQPDLVLLIGDRYEAHAVAIAASYMNICIAHIQGGEVSGSIDESTRHCITKLSHYHFPATKQAAKFIVNMGEKPETVFHVGCPSGDIVFNEELSLPDNIFEGQRHSCALHPHEPYLLVVFHPVTTEYGSEKQETDILLETLSDLRLPTVWLWPNIDAGADQISKTIRSYRLENDAKWLGVFKNFSPEDYLKVLANAECAIGNSSSFVRDASFIGTPVVLVGDRQCGREIDAHVTKTACEVDALNDAIRKQLTHGKYPSSKLYGDGNASEKIVDILKDIDVYVQKHLHYGTGT